MIASWIFTSLAASSRTPILTYHDIIPVRTKDSLWFDCSVKELKDQISWLRARGAVFVSSADIIQAFIQKKPLPKKAICITFADNYEGFYKFAWPIMRELRIPVTQFVHTGFVGSTVGRKKMTWPQLIELDRSGLVTIASQTVTHPADLTKMKSKDVLAEFMKSKQQLEFKLGHRITQLAYPNGKFDNRISDLAKQAGFTAAFTEECLPSETGKNQFQIPRYVHTKIRIAWNSKAATP